MAQNVQGRAFRSTDEAGTLTMRAGRQDGFRDGRTQALAGHFQQTEMGNMPDLDAGAIGAQGFLETLLHLCVVTAAFHVDEVDHDQTGQIAQTQLAGDFLGGFEVRAQGRFLDVALEVDLPEFTSMATRASV